MAEAPVPEQDTEVRPPGPDPQGSPPTDSDASAGPSPTAEADEGGSPVTSAEEIEEEELEISDLEAQLLDDMDRLQSERNDYLDQLLRTRADFDNYRKRILKQQSDYELRAAEALVEKLLEPLDTFDLAMAHGQGFEQARDMLVNALTKEGLERIDPAGKPFDPNEADAVAHEEGEGGPVVAEVLRPGYRWKGRVIRPAMVKVRG
jgi:molecular chaperone GrpE